MKFYIITIVIITGFIWSGCTKVTPDKSRFPQPPETKGKMVFIPTFDDGPIDEKYVEFGVFPKSEEEMLASLHKTLKVLKEKNVTAVFFVVYVHAEKDAPKWSPKSNEERMKKVFADGIKLITDAGHVVALHACDHDMFHKLFLPFSEAKEDMEYLIDQLNASGCEYYPTWRVPYGGMRTFMNEQRLAKELGVPIKLWDVNAHDWTTNHDSTPTLKRIFAADSKWTANVNKNIRREIRKTRRRPAGYRDVLFHVSERTSKFLGEFLDTVEDEGKKVYGDRFMYMPINAPYKTAIMEYYLTSEPVVNGKPVTQSK